MREDGRLSTDQKTVSRKNRWRPTDATHAAAHTCARSFRADASHTEIHSSTHGSGPQAVLTRLPDTWARSPLVVGSGKSRSGRERTCTRTLPDSRRPGRLWSLLLPVLRWLLPLFDAFFFFSPFPPLPTDTSHSAPSSSFCFFTPFSSWWDHLFVVLFSSGCSVLPPSVPEPLVLLYVSVITSPVFDWLPDSPSPGFRTLSFQPVDSPSSMPICIPCSSSDPFQILLGSFSSSSPFCSCPTFSPPSSSSLPLSLSPFFSLLALSPALPTQFVRPCPLLGRDFGRRPVDGGDASASHVAASAEPPATLDTSSGPEFGQQAAHLPESGSATHPAGQRRGWRCGAWGRGRGRIKELQGQSGRCRGAGLSRESWQRGSHDGPDNETRPGR